MRRIAKRFSALLIMVCMIVIMMPALGDSGVAHAASKIRLNKTTVYIAKGSSVKLKVLGTKARVKWKSSKKSIAKKKGPAAKPAAKAAPKAKPARVVKTAAKKAAK